MLKSIFKRVTATDVITEQLKEAEVMALQHEAAEEYHRAQARMYRERIGRLKASPGIVMQQSRAST